MQAETVNVSDSKQTKGRKKKHELAREGELEDMRVLMKTPSGRRFIWRVLSKCHMFHTTSHHDPTSMAIKSGERDVGLWVLGELTQADPNSYIALHSEQQKRNDK